MNINIDENNIKEEKRFNLKKLLIYIFVGLLVIALTIVYARFKSTSGIKVNEYKVTNNIVTDSFHGLKVVHFSDIHFGNTVDIEYLGEIVDEINKLDGDLVVFTGDLLDKEISVEEKNNIISVLGGVEANIGKYAISGEGENASEINMILDHNTTPLVAWNSSGNNADGMNEVKTALETDTTGWKQTARLITADEVAEITGAKDALDWTSDKTYANTPVKGTSISYFYLDGADGTDTTWHTQIAKTQGTSKYAWLYDNTNGCESYGCNIADLSTYGYWTSTPVVGNSAYAWHVHRGGGLSSSTVSLSDYRGVRPVITISKSIISQD